MNEEQLEAIKETITFLSDLENRGDYGAKNLKYKLQYLFSQDNELTPAQKQVLREFKDNYGLGIG